jgi:hypothetical protein
MTTDEINIDPDIWGPGFWSSMEALACTINQRNKKNIGFFFENLRTILPCENCRNHYNLYCNDFPVEKFLQNSLTLLVWLYQLKIKIKSRQERTVPKFIDWLEYLIEKYNIPEIYYHLDKNNEFLDMMKRWNMKPSVALKKYRLREYQACLDFQN